VHQLILVTGGARSGKSDFAQALGSRLGGDDVLFVATAQAGDEEMAQRIAVHRRARPAAWRTLEASRGVGRALRQAGPASVVIIDCLTMLVSNLLLSFAENATFESTMTAVDVEAQELIEALRATKGTGIVVTNEVGLGIVPAHRMARLYRDLLGRANALLARQSDQVYLLVSGLALEIKSLAQEGSH